MHRSPAQSRSHPNPPTQDTPQAIPRYQLDRATKHTYRAAGRNIPWSEARRRARRLFESGKEGRW